MAYATYMEGPLSGSRASSHLALATLVFVAAANLRPAISAVGPLLETIGDETGAGPTALGALGALPVFTFALVSPFVHLLSRRWGMDRTVLAALTVLTLGTVARSAGGEAVPLFVGTLILSAAVAVLNVVLPAVGRRDFPDRVPVMTGAYTAVMTGVAALASSTAVPLSGALNWELALAAAAALSLLAALLWGWRLGRSGPGEAVDSSRTGREDSSRSVWSAPWPGES
ncbi:MFS transporter [Nesterenkonia sp. NBAIMH1]|uniref:MFS transporter n=1 Tax=Nesterenkonia sp. NBAIMH1 TaxID=2600320 RepID=UPI00143E0219|nr:MFS transporter [Nesterenkonia sp. NBAIMH1]